MHEFPPASIHVRRHLTPYELAAIAVGLELLATAPASVALEEMRTTVMPDAEFPNIAALRALAAELLAARKVKVCRSKRSQA